MLKLINRYTQNVSKASPLNKTNSQITSKAMALKIFSLFLALFLLFQSNTILAEVSASTARTVISIDETLVLEITSKNNSGTPDLTELEDDFQIMGRSQSQNYSLINGNASRTHTWNITLLPKKTGEISIPSIKIGNEITDIIHLIVQKQSKTPAVDGKQVFLEIEISDSSEDSSSEEEPVQNTEQDAEPKNNKEFYVQQQIIVTVKLFHRIRFSNASLSELELDNTVVEKLGNDANYNKVISNHRYNIIERRYAIYPQQSGELTIPVLTFSGNAEISQNFSLFSRPGRQIISRTKPITLNILPIPSSYTGTNWLPAESLEIEAEIVEDTNSIIEGEAITRNIIVRAKGLLGSQLPVTTVNSSKLLKTYPDKEKLSNQLVDGQVVGIRHDTVAIIPLKAGKFILPEIKIDWWNTKTNQQITTHLAALTLVAQQSIENSNNDANQQSTPVDNVSNNEVSNIVSNSSGAIPMNALSKTKSTQKTDKIIEKTVYKDIKITKNIWFWISIALFIIWLITLALLIVALSNNKKSIKKETSNTHRSKHHKNCLQSVYSACLENNAHKASKALIQWARYYYKQPMLSGLSDIIRLIDDEHLSNAIYNLESSQYSQNTNDWDGNMLSTALSHCIKQDKTREQEMNKKAPAFSSLNPE
ncbi:MAG: BatD family protein [Gammaproteobacteria bacterium]|nr:BatD family protein [Gammaproteobacteria bacterium]